MSWSVHVYFHVGVHRSGTGWLSRIGGLLATAVMGMPFDGYRLHHRNHHRYNNEEGDVSRTWTPTANGPKARNPLWYTCAWPLDVARAMAWVRQEVALGAVEKWIRRRIIAQQILLVILITLLMSWSYVAGLLYLLYIYLGWAFIALHNYGQHPPISGAARSLHSRWYNVVTANNGLHVEHHAQPGANIATLIPDTAARKTSLPHPLTALWERT